MADICEAVVSDVQELLEQAILLSSVTIVAEELKVAPSTVHRWLKGETAPKAYIDESLRAIIKKHRTTSKTKKNACLHNDINVVL